MADQVFQPLPTVPDHASLEEEILAWWEAQGTFEQLRERNRGGPTFSFIDGPVPANKPLGVPHACCRTLTDVFQRYTAPRGFDQRYQDGFDCQGLWIEVGVERNWVSSSGDRGVRPPGIPCKCRDPVVRSAAEITGASASAVDGLGEPLLAPSDTNIEYVWRCSRRCRERLAL
jgi:isoleucyl-tRNA synthetase